MNGDGEKLVTITPLTTADVEGAYEVFETTIPAAFSQEGLGSLLEDIWNEITHKKSRVQAFLQRDLNSEAANTPMFLVARNEGKVVGTISYGPCGDAIRDCTNHRLDQIGELGTLYVLPELHGQGIASALIAALVTELQRRGITQFCLDSGYRIAQQKWRQKFGEPYAVVNNYWGEGADHMVWLCEVQDFTVK
ncbi:GNAT superfamily N-acetyltransferase [Paenibacillus sp. JGP012]|uniref:GNAT family N-acetyltransferase n=1 Tax=Paenibacillus sp. JGP012 TaxID=2735914 RepID=UPI001619C136|nr:GNAT family N-acetyltransferase [Paenibacillus sp. JGP012]MBB6021191.1 GNAT superfamily N-acetyltransferase [Paenibacillus sp. JGP012]